jgi:hypothetical protein
MTQGEEHGITTTVKTKPPLQYHSCNTTGTMLQYLNTTMVAMSLLPQQNCFNVTPAAPLPK